MNCCWSVVAPSTFVVPQYWSPARLYSITSLVGTMEPEPFAEKKGFGYATCVFWAILVVAIAPHVLQPPRLAVFSGGEAVVVCGR